MEPPIGVVGNTDREVTEPPIVVVRATGSEVMEPPVGVVDAVTIHHMTTQTSFVPELQPVDGASSAITFPTKSQDSPSSFDNSLYIWTLISRRHEHISPLHMMIGEVRMDFPV